jgi:hypothetical protein
MNNEYTVNQIIDKIADVESAKIVIKRTHAHLFNLNKLLIDNYELDKSNPIYQKAVLYISKIYQVNDTIIDHEHAILYLKKLKIDEIVLQLLLKSFHKIKQYNESYKYVLEYESNQRELNLNYSKYYALKTLILMNDYKKLCEYVNDFNNDILFDIYKIISDDQSVYDLDIISQLQKLNKPHELTEKLIDYCHESDTIIKIFNIYTEKGIMYNPDLIYEHILKNDTCVEWICCIKNLELIDDNKYTFLMYVINRNINTYDNEQKRIYSDYDYAVICKLIMCGADPKYEINEPPYNSPLSLAVKCHDDIILIVMKAINEKGSTIYKK